MSPKGLKYIFHLIGRKLFGRDARTTCDEVEYGQTLSKKRRRNCVLKKVAALSEPPGPPQIDDWVDAPYHIKFEFSSDEREFRGSVLNFQKIDPYDACCLRKCCEKCFCTMDANSVSSDSACDVKSDASPRLGRTVEDFIRIHNENFLLREWDAEPSYESLPRGAAKSDCDYDILLSKSDWNVLEPSYENLKLVENFYETPKNITIEKCSESCAVRRIKDLVQCNKTYDEVIESLKVLHKGATTCGCDNDVNYYLDSFKAYEKDANNDVESVSFQY